MHRRFVKIYHSSGSLGGMLDGSDSGFHSSSAQAKSSMSISNMTCITKNYQNEGWLPWEKEPWDSTRCARGPKASAISLVDSQAVSTRPASPTQKSNNVPKSSKIVNMPQVYRILVLVRWGKGSGFPLSSIS